jgi:magnesium transporter
VISARCYPDGTSKTIEPGEVSEVIKNPRDLVWVDVAGATEDDLTLLQEEFSLHPLAIEDVRKHHQRPKLEHYPTHAFLVGHTAGRKEVDIFVGPTWLVTVREDEGADDGSFIERARTRFERSRPEQATVGFLLYMVLDELVDGYFLRSDELEDEVEEIENVIFAEASVDEREIQQQVFEMRRRLLSYRRLAVPMRDVVSALLRREVEWVDDNAVTHLQDVYDHVLRVIETVDHHREIMGNAVEAHLAIIGNQQNRVMKRMTSWGAILLGSTLVAGIYGMNFTHMPELEWAYGFWWALSLMALITVAGYLWFRSRGWL